MHENKMYSIVWCAIAAVIITLILSVTYYNLQKPSKNEMYERLVGEYKVNPMIMRCLELDWGFVANYEICKSVADNHELSEEETKRLRDLLNSR